MKRKIKRIVIHCSAGPQTQTAAQIVAFHLRPVAKGGRGWKQAGYHYIVEASGKIVPAVPEDEIANGAKGYNSDSLHVCYIGGIDANKKPIDNRTPAQREALRTIVADLRRRYGSQLPAVGHRDLSPDLNGNGIIEPKEWIKACPCFDVATEL